MTPAGTADPQAHLRRWTATWVALGLVVVLVTAVFLVLIGNSLVSINSNLTAADRAVTDVAGHTRTLPDQIADVNAALTKIDGALTSLPQDTEAVTANLEEIRNSLRAVDGSLADSAPRLAKVSDNLTATSDLVDPLAAGLLDTSALLRQILGSTGRIRTSLVEVNGSTDTGLAGIEALVRSINAHLSRTSGDLGNILDGVTDINLHLENVCRSTAVNLLHGRQSC